MRNHRNAMRYVLGLMLVAGTFLGVAPRTMAAAAGPACTSPSSGAVSSITLPSVSISPGVAVGTLLGSPGTATVVFNCANITGSYGVVTIQAGNLAALDATNSAGSGSIKFATNTPGIAVKLTATPNQADSGPNGPGGVPGWELNAKTNTSSSITTTFTAQLIKTGPITPGTVSSINLLQLTNYSYGHTNSANYYVTVVLNPVTVTMTACNVLTSSVAVTLPTIDTRSLGSLGSVAGTTPFNIQYSCPSGWSLYMTMSTANPGTASGVILPSTSCAQGTPATSVGVQLLQSNRQAVQFNAAQALGSSPSGTLTIPYYAQYYATGSPVGTGAVCATATFTMSYQ